MDATCDEEDAYFCTFCGASLASLKELIQHNRKAHKISDNNSGDESVDMDESENPDETGALDESQIKQIVDAVYNPDSQNKIETKKRKSRTPSAERVKCELCNRQFSSSLKLERHTQAHLGIRVKDCKCEVCGKVFSHNGNLKTHMRSHTGDRPYGCKECGRCFSVSSHLKRHMLLHSGERPFRCMVCEKQFTQSGNLKAHIRTHSNNHNGRRRKVCSEQKADENKKPKAADDINDEEEKQPDGCSTPVGDGANKLAISADENDGIVDETMKSELDGDAGQIPPKNSCKVCGKKFSHPSNLTVHMRVHSADRPFQCNLCQMMFTVSSHLRRHLLVHSGEKPFACTLCGKHFRQSGNLSIHMKVHSKTPAKECAVCGMNFVLSRRLAEHMQQMHPDDTAKHRCEECGKVYAKASNLAAHRRKHAEDVKQEDGKQLRCPKCAEDFTDAQDLVSHMTEHAGDDDGVAVCAECGETFSDASKLAAHVETEHMAHEETLSEKPHKCMYCGERFVRASELVTHIAMCALSLRHVKQESGSTGEKDVDDPDDGSDTCLEKELQEILHSRPESPLPATSQSDSGFNTQSSSHDAENVVASKELEQEDGGAAADD